MSVKDWMPKRPVQPVGESEYSAYIKYRIQQGDRLAEMVIEYDNDMATPGRTCGFAENWSNLVRKAREIKE